MNKFSFCALTASLLALSACTTATLVEVKLDAASLTSIAQTSPTPFTLGQGEGVVELPFGSQQEGIPILLPSDVTDAATKLQIRAEVDLNVTGSLTGSLGLYIAPAGAAIAVTPEYKIPTGQDCANIDDNIAISTDKPVNEASTKTINVNLTLSPTAAGNCKTAFERIRSGSFKLGITVSASATTDVSVNYVLKKFDLSITGYPIRIIF
jgi:hypothetical protein